MRCFMILFIIFTLFIQQPYAANEDTDIASDYASLSPHEKADSLLSAADRLSVTDTLSAIEYIRQALDVSKKSEYFNGHVHSLKKLADLYYGIREYDESVRACEDALSLLEGNGRSDYPASLYERYGHSLSATGRKEDARNAFHHSSLNYLAQNDSLGIARSARNLGIYFLRISQYDSALVYYPVALEYYSALGVDERVAAMTNSIGSAYYQLGLYDKALVHFQRSLDIRRNIDDREGITRVLNNIGLLNFNLGNLDASKRYFSEAIVIARETGADGLIGYSLHNIGRIEEAAGNNDIALEYYRSALAHRRKTAEKTNLVQNLDAIGSVLVKTGDHQQAMRYLDEALKLAKSLQYREGLATVLNSIGRARAVSGLEREARESYLQSLAITRVTGNRELAGETLNNLVEMHESSGKYRDAFEYYRQYVALKDSLFSEETAENINQLRIAYETEQKERENASLRQRQKNQELLLSRNRTIILLISISLVTGVIFMVILLMMYRGKLQANNKLKKTNEKITEQRDEIQQKNADLEDALSHIKTLSGLLPICASCKKIRDDDGYWNDVEGYITKHSEAIFSHGICPDCMKKLYPDLKAAKSPNASGQDQS